MTVSAKAEGNAPDDASDVPVPKIKGKRRWGMPNWNAQARLLAGGDLRATMLLIRIIQAWNGNKRKLRRCGREWVAMPLEDWWRSAGLNESECNKYAIPLLKANCDFLRFEAWKIKQGGPKMLWVSVDEVAMNERFAYVDEIGLTHGGDYHQPLKGIGHEYETDEDGTPIINGKPAKLGYYCLAKLTAVDLNRKRKAKPQGDIAPWCKKPKIAGIPL